MEWYNYINCIFIVHNSIYSVLVFAVINRPASPLHKGNKRKNKKSNIITWCMFYGYTALPNWFYLFINVCNFKFFLLSHLFSLIRNSHFLQLYM